MEEAQSNSRDNSPRRKENTTGSDTAEQAERHEGDPNAHPRNREFRWLSRGHGQGTNLNHVPSESRPWTRSYLIRRPRALQYESKTTTSPDHNNIENKQSSGVVQRITTNHETMSQITPRNSNNSENGSQEEKTLDDPAKQLSRVDLFVDLVWVGIIANISATFGEQAFERSDIGIGIAILQFILVFLPIWRIWDYLRTYNSNFFIDDFMQRTFIVWILILAVVYGINAPYAFVADGQSSLRYLVTIYLIARGSFLIVQLWPAICIPWLRPRWYFEAATVLIATAFWVGALFTEYPTRLGLIFAANIAEHPLLIYGSSPLADRFLTQGHKKVANWDHAVERFEGFFIIILGEGVFRLIEGSPEGIGLNQKTGTALCSLLMYYILHWLYFQGDQSKVYVHALRRTWWKPILWQT
jgi:low temperature requirement protein LtrA